MGQIIGIDLGTTNSLSAVFLDGKPVLIPNAMGSFLTPSIVGVLDDGQLLVGSPAKELRVTRPERCASTFKRYMGTARVSTVAGKEYSSPELSSLVLKSLKHDAEEFLGEEVTEAVITVPAYFNDHQRKATRRAGEIAGLKVRRIINEPTAAALTYGFHDRDSDKKLIVIDLGGGTFDVTLMEIFEGTLEIISTAGESFLGGEDFTDRLVATVLNKLGKELEIAEVKHPLLVSRLRQECETAKCTLFHQDSTLIRVPDESGTYDDNSPKIKMTRENFAKVSTRLIDRLKKPIGKVLRDADCMPQEIDDVIFVGGATRMQIVNECVAEYFKKPPLSSINPDEVVGLGAAIQAALISDDAAVDDMVMTDVCPFTLGVETAKKFGQQVMDGYYVPVIHRNTTIPVSKEELFSTMYANQAEVNLKIFQGESRRVKDNLLLGELRITGIPPGPEGQPVQVRFTYDLNGILEVEAYVTGSGHKFQTVLTQHAQDLSTGELEDAVEKMQALKFYPRDDLRNQRLVLFCERMVGEISPMHREQLEMALDYFEHAMSSGEKEEFESAHERLLITLSTLGIDYEEEQESGPNDA